MNDKAQSVRLPGAKIRLKFNGKAALTIAQGCAKGVQDEGKGRREGIPISQPRTAKNGNVTDRSHLVNLAILSSRFTQQQQARSHQAQRLDARVQLPTQSLNPPRVQARRNLAERSQPTTQL